MKEMIQIHGARENNLKNITLSIPKHKLVVLTGPSGSGKSTLAMDTLQRECQRQYMESMGMTTDGMSKPKVDSIIGLSPSISVGQHITNRNPRSTMGTVTDMYTMLRLIFEKLGERPCPHCHTTVIPALDKELFDEETGFKQFITCPNCQHRFEKLTRSHFSFNKPEGACHTCEGLGQVTELDTASVFDEALSLNEGAVLIPNWKGDYGSYQINVLQAAAKHYGFIIDADLPLKHLNGIQRDLLCHGVESETFSAHFPDIKPPKTVGKGKFEGVVTGIWRRYKEKGGQSQEAAFFSHTCPNCHGKRLKQASRQVKVLGEAITDVVRFPLEQLHSWLKQLDSALPAERKEVMGAFLDELILKVRRMIRVGLGYLFLDRQTITLSGGEAQRIRLDTILGSGLTGVLYILDEPTAGLHPKDTKGLIDVLRELRDLGNTVLVIEHDVTVMREADYIIDMGPGAGSSGGMVVGEGDAAALISQEQSVTGAFLKHGSISDGRQPRKGTSNYLTVHHATKHNLKDITVSFPLGCFVSVTGANGSGKSTLVFDLLAEGIDHTPDGCGKITDFEKVSKVVTVTQAPLGRMKRSNIATYTEIFTFIRNLFAGLPEAKERNLKPKDFSFNTQGGRCEHCQGLGFVLTNMYFMNDLEVTCPVCRGNRFKAHILEIKYKEHSISDILDMTIEESLPAFDDHKKIIPVIHLLCEIGLGYLKWGQAVTTLSGGEGQRLKLAKELTKKSADHTLYLLDEPSTGLHPTDVKQLLLLLNRLVDAGNSVIVIEHNSDVIQASDWVIDLGPEGGEAGGRIVAEGTPAAIAAAAGSYTGSFLH